MTEPPVVTSATACEFCGEFSPCACDRASKAPTLVARCLRNATEAQQ